MGSVMGVKDFQTAASDAANGVTKGAAGATAADTLAAAIKSAGAISAATSNQQITWKHSDDKIYTGKLQDGKAIVSLVTGGPGAATQVIDNPPNDVLQAYVTK